MAVPIVRYSGKAKTNSWARWMTGRTMRKNNNNLVSVIGKTGSGKTWSAISVCEIMSKIDGVPFTVDHIVFDLRELMNLINSGTLKRGSKIVFDEPQCSISAREFQSDANKVFNLLVSTFRHRNLSLFFCTPFESLLDKNTRKLFHGRFETKGINPNKGTCRLSPRFLEYSDFKTDAYRKQLVVLYKEGGEKRVVKVDYWDVPKPTPELIIEYEKKKKAFTTKLNENILARLDKFDESGKSMTAEKKEEEVIRKPLTPTQEEVMNTLANHNYKESSKILGKALSTLHANKKLALKKGYTLEEFRKNE
jgi:ABC-type oligopeptide transport system ATPase subunit